MASPGQMGSAAGLTVESFDLDRTQDTFALDGLADAGFGQFLRSAKPHGHFAVLKNDFVGAALRVFQLARSQRRRFEIDGGSKAPEMERFGLEAKKFDERGGKQMLAGVLLHVIDPARPIDLALNRANRKCGGGVVHHVVRHTCWRRDRRSWRRAERQIRDFQDFDFAETAEVVGLAAGSGVERRAVQNNFPAVAFTLAGNDVRLEFLLKRIVVIQPFSHLEFPVTGNF